MLRGRNLQSKKVEGPGGSAPRRGAGLAPLAERDFCDLAGSRCLRREASPAYCLRAAATPTVRAGSAGGAAVGPPLLRHRVHRRVRRETRLPLAAALPTAPTMGSEKDGGSGRLGLPPGHGAGRARGTRLLRPCRFAVHATRGQPRFLFARSRRADRARGLRWRGSRRTARLSDIEFGCWSAVDCGCRWQPHVAGPESPFEKHVVGPGGSASRRGPRRSRSSTGRAGPISSGVFERLRGSRPGGLPAWDTNPRKRKAARANSSGLVNFGRARRESAAESTGTHFSGAGSSHLYLTPAVTSNCHISSSML
jgi:hypothetical protein